jgi:hypothetical protein
MGFCITIIVGYASSLLLKALNCHGNDKVYIDGNRNHINFDLFMPPIAQRLRKKFAKNDEHLISKIVLQSVKPIYE